MPSVFCSTGPPEGGRVVGILLFIRSEAKKGRFFCNDSVSSGEVSRTTELCIVGRSITASLFDAGLPFLYHIEHGGNIKGDAGKGGRRG